MNIFIENDSQTAKCYSIQIGNIEIDRIGNNSNEQPTKHLDMHIDENFTWKHHIAAVKGKVSPVLF